MRVIYLILVSLLCACNNNIAPLIDTQLQPAYSVIIEADNPLIAKVSLRLKDKRAAPIRLMSRAESLGTTSQVKNVTCQDEIIYPDEMLIWSIPTNCSIVSWRIEFDEPEPSSVQPSQQRSLYMASEWWVISAPTSLLRIESHSSDIPVDILVSNRPAVKRTLRTINAPPNFYVLGPAPENSSNTDKLKLTYFGEDLDTVSKVINPEKHKEAIRYFNSVIGAESARKVSELSVVWFGVPRERREVSGAAGYDTILANFIIPEDKPKDEEQLMSLALVFHEQFHQLDSGSHPVWMGESLANYYALKALKRLFPDNKSADDIWNRFINAEHPTTMGLLDIEREISKDQNRQNYGLLYTQGATFWSELDTAIQQYSSNDESLDSFMPAMMNMNVGSDETSFSQIENLLSVIPTQKMNIIKTKYLD